MFFCSQELQLKNIELENDGLNVKTYDNIRGMYHHCVNSPLIDDIV